MADEYISRAEHDEFRRRQDEANIMQNERLDKLELQIEGITEISKNVERLAVNMENMLKAQEEQNTRLKSLESRDGEKWRAVVGYVLTAIISLGAGFFFTQFIGG